MKHACTSNQNDIHNIFSNILMITNQSNYLIYIQKVVMIFYYRLIYKDKRMIRIFILRSIYEANDTSPL